MKAESFQVLIALSSWGTYERYRKALFGHIELIVLDSHPVSCSTEPVIRADWCLYIISLFCGNSGLSVLRISLSKCILKTREVSFSLLY